MPRHQNKKLYWTVFEQTKGTCVPYWHARTSHTFEWNALRNYRTIPNNISIALSKSIYVLSLKWIYSKKILGLYIDCLKWRSILSPWSSVVEGSETWISTASQLDHSEVPNRHTNTESLAQMTKNKFYRWPAWVMSHVFSITLYSNIWFCNGKPICRVEYTKKK